MPLPMFDRAALAAQRHTYPAAPTPRSRASATRFLTGVRTAREIAFQDGDRVRCPQGIAWERQAGRWYAPGQPWGLTLPDQEITTWWLTRHQPGSQFTLHRHTPSTTT